MMILGLTGGIASGKSTVLRIFARLGAATYDADRAVHSLLNKDMAAAQAIHHAFPQIPAALPVDRKALGALVFEDEAAMRQLEAIIHPRVRDMELTAIRLARLKQRRLIVCDIPLLFETGAQNRYDAVITVVCPGYMQRQRALARPNMTPQRYAHILARQMPLHEKLKRTDFMVHTGQGLALSMREVKTIMIKLGLA